MTKIPEGFPLVQRERDALKQLLPGLAKRPYGAAMVTLGNLTSRNWITRVALSEDEEIAAEAYAVTEDGKIAFEIDTISINMGAKRPPFHARALSKNAYRDLRSKLAALKNSN